MRFAFVTSEISPFIGGGIAPMVRATAQTLIGAGHHVDLFTRASYRPLAAVASAADAPFLNHPRLRWHWVREPANDSRHWHSELARNFETAVDDAYRRGSAPDLVELQDYLGLGAGIAAGRCAGALGDAVVVTRLNTSSEQAAALDGVPLAGREGTRISALERASLRNADVLLAPSPAVHDYYLRFYDDEVLPPQDSVWPGFLIDDAPLPQPRPKTESSVNLLYLGRLQGFKGTDLLVSALRRLPELPVQLTLVGGDTPTGPEGSSMLAHLRRIARMDKRIRFLGPVPRAQIGQHLAASNALVIPSRWETWGNVGLEALAARRALLVTPVGSLPAMAGHGEFGVVAPSVDEDGVAALLQNAWDDRQRIRDLAGSGALSTHLDELTDQRRLVAEYERLAAGTPRVDRPDGEIDVLTAANAHMN